MAGLFSRTWWNTETLRTGRSAPVKNHVLHVMAVRNEWSRAAVDRGWPQGYILRYRGVQRTDTPIHPHQIARPPAFHRDSSVRHPQPSIHPPIIPLHSPLPPLHPPLVYQSGPVNWSPLLCRGARITNAGPLQTQHAGRSTGKSST